MSNAAEAAYANGQFHEVWWIYSPLKEEWAYLRIAHFRKSMNGSMLIIILGEDDRRRGLRIWDDIKDREGWVMVQQIPIPPIPA